MVTEPSHVVLQSLDSVFGSSVPREKMVLTREDYHLGFFVQSLQSNKHLLRVVDRRAMVTIGM